MFHFDRAYSWIAGRRWLNTFHPHLGLPFPVDVVTASAYSLFIVGITSFVGAIPKYKDHLVNIRMGFLFGVPSLVSIFVTRKWIVPAIPDMVYQTESLALTKRMMLLGLFAFLMLLASVSMIKDRNKEQEPDYRFRPFLVIVEGTAIGLLTGLVGAGGGFLIIPALIFFTGLNFKTAVGTSLFVIAINSVTGFTGDVLNYAINWKMLCTITALSVVGVLIGNYYSKKIKQLMLRKAFGWFVLVTGCLILMKEFVLID